MKYRNTVTGAVVETACVIKGGKWEVVKDQKTKATTNKGTAKKSGK